jgi:aryl-phospho-beta-D-glucosidase BglC (GH1 family)
MKNALIILALALLAFACGEPVQPEPVETPGPALVSTSPADGIGGIEGPSLSIVFTFDQNILCTPASLEGVSVDGGAFIDKASPAGATLTVVVSGLARGKHYTVTLPAGTVRGFKPDQPASFAISFNFSTKEPDPAPDPGGWESAASAVKNMGAGWNLGNTLDSNSNDVDHMWIESKANPTPSDYETAWGQPVTTRALIHLFKEAGFKAIRVPVTWYPHMGTLEVNGGHWDKAKWLESKDYRVDAAWMKRVREVVDYVIDEGMYCILNVHHDTGAESAAWLVASEADFDAVKDRYQSLWEQIANTFRDYGEKLLFESYNEMLDPLDSWCFASFNSEARYDAAVARSAYAGINNYADLFVKTVRATGGNNAVRNLVVNTYGACSGAGTWNSHLQEPLSQFDLPEAPGHIAVQVHSYWEADKFDAQKADIDRQFADLDRYVVQRLGVPVIIGEWGGGVNEDTADMVRFAGYFSQKAKDAGMAALYWMCLSDGADRAVPAWTTPGVKDAILKPYL